MVTSGCEGAIIPPSDAQERPPGGQGAAEGPPAVDVATAATANGQELRDYLGTTRPHREVAVRSRMEGPLLALTADVGDAVGRGQVLARLDDRLLATESSENAAEIAALELEVSAAQAQVGEAQARVEEVRVQVGQARADVARFSDLVGEGALPERELETAKSTLAGLEKSLQAAQQQVRQQQDTVAVARKRVVAQRAIAAGSSERQSFSVVRSPISGRVLARVLEPGSLAQPGSEILTLGDFSQLEIEVRLTDRDLAAVRPGLAVQVRLDAFPDETFTGRVTRISPTADPVARQIPVEVTIPNPGGRIGGGLLARVQFAPTQAARVAIPEQALSAGSQRRGGRGGAGQPMAARSTAPNPSASNGATGGSNAAGAATTGQVFLVQGEGDSAIVVPQTVQLGDRSRGQVEILSGLQPGDRYVLRSSGPLQGGDRVRLSFISQTANP